jgi:hypothetical protein
MDNEMDPMIMALMEMWLMPLETGDGTQDEV